MKTMGKICRLAGVMICLVLPLSGTAEAKLYLAEPVLVTQPSYTGMRFYVYKPYNMPNDWYATFDGYPVMKNKDGVWVYGAYSGPNLTPTHYVVGSIVPSMAGLLPYADPVRVSSTATLPSLQTQTLPIVTRQPEVKGTPKAPARANSKTPASDKTPDKSSKTVVQSTYMPDWLFDGRFMALGRWKESVDRIGILKSPGVPVAWKGDSPLVIYAWNGKSWHQIMARDGERPSDALKRNIYELVKQVKGNGFTWYEADMPILSQQAGQWGYYWMGEVAPR